MRNLFTGKIGYLAKDFSKGHIEKIAALLDKDCGKKINLPHKIVAVNDENEIMTLSSYQRGEYNQEGLYIGVPTIIGANGVKEILELKLKCLIIILMAILL